MDENLKTTKYQNGDLIGTTTPATLDISYESLPEYQWAYGGNENNVSTYGRLYTWYAATDSRILCPSGWHIATDFEWTTLTNYLRDNGYGYEGSGSDIAKSIASTIGWNSSTEAGSIGSDLTSNNSSGFTSLPGGDRINDGTFLSLGNTSDWWAGTEFDASYGYFRNLYFDNNNMTQGYSYKNYGYAVRCLLTKFGTVTDYEGNAYKTVQLGPQEWMTENLKSTKYRDGTSIPYVIDDLGWDALTTPAYCWYLNDPTSYKNIYGALYNWYTVNTGKLCPTGWHVPIRADWLTLIDYLGGLDLAYEKLKSTTGWIGYGANNGTNESGFAAVPGGDRTYGTYGFMGDWGNWWSSTSYDPNTVWYLFIQSGSTNFVDLFTTNYKNSGYSVRCLKD
jgi:uncharacterized protein (TIGR02145 family)